MDKYIERDLKIEQENIEIGKSVGVHLKLRDQFAAAVLPQVYAKTVTNHPSFDLNEVARKAYKMADAMLAARNPQ